MPEISHEVRDYVTRCAQDCAPIFDKLSAIERANTRKVLGAFQRHRVSARNFAPTTGYGYDDIGRDTLGLMFAEVMGCEAALVRPQIASGTHALALCLLGALRPGACLVCATGAPYDTMRQVIGTEGTPGQGSLKEYGVDYRQVEMTPSGTMDIPAVLSAIDGGSVGMVLIQRSRGYEWRRSLTVHEIKEVAQAVHAAQPDILVMVDNCYGEFTEEIEPGDAGVDLLAGSLIKNPGGGLAPTGGYIAGTAKAVERISYRLTSPGIGAEVGSYAGSYQPFYQGLFSAPHVTMQAIQSAVLAARGFEGLGYDVHPAYDEPRSDIIEAIKFNAPEPLIAFVQAIQKASPVDSEAVPEPWGMPGYADQVIMAAGTFVAGASIELSADAPIRAPYIGYLQGSLTYAHGYTAIECAVQTLVRAGHAQVAK